ncbi:MULTISPECIES: TetR/AcrR family transcriptional regulator C-terminal domain-containing protein [Rhizobium]|uniref:Transcriptional regulator, TetR family n=1 Tax=Rhizobium favelukesii TaxID=348824 RepID=W6RJF0_9HYPH|nr:MULTISPECIES: TetR/AcrR family transcriptional regulator C-terminal domain-containing protein [Rhizobium]MCS0459822.1 TetR/AcrR family transcriptional regulator C-terminal domain-containing protein [Rhizobium favelukesii]UFS85281.1 TetR/AcrR family transcriptional regulator C-terminal domain-containing protein [Rhizobium sp. T136]CDM61292.1 transcriptional regulator, TetR family [Rhizobium favelukesii]
MVDVVSNVVICSLRVVVQVNASGARPLWAPIEEMIARIFRIDRGGDDQAILVRTIVRDSSGVPELAEALGTNEVLRSRQDLAEWLSGQVEKGLLRLDDPLSGARLLMDMIFGGMEPPDG